MKNHLSILIALCFFLPIRAEKSVLIFSGGWKGHRPHATAAFLKTLLEEQGFSVTCTNTLTCLEDAEALTQYDLIIPNWSMGKINSLQLTNLLSTVEAGTGLAGIHGGMGDAFRKTPAYEKMVGGHFIKHPHVGPYTVDAVTTNHPVLTDIPDSFDYHSEQYFMKMDTDIIILAETDYSSVEPGLRMPTVWVKQHGTGRVFYSALGHDVMKEYQASPEAKQLFINGCRWAARKKQN